MNKRPLLILFATLFCVMTGFGIIIPALPFYTLKLHGDARMVGLLMASYSAMNVLCAPLWGRLSDRVGRKPVLLAGILGLALSFLLFGLASTPLQLFAARMIGGALGAAALPTAMAYGGDLSTDENRGKALGLLGAGLGLGMVVGPALGGLAEHGAKLMPFLHEPEQAPFVLAAALSLVTAAFVAFALPKGTPKASERLGFAAAFRLTGRILWPLYLVTFLQMLAFTDMEATFVLFAKDHFQLGMMQVGLMFMAMGLVSAGFQGGGVGKLIQKHGETAVTRAGCVVLGLGFVLVPMTHSALQLLGAFCFFGVGSALLRTSLSAGVSKGATAGQGTAMGMQQSFEALARVFGPAIGGFLYQAAPALPYQAGVGVMVLAALVAWTALGLPAANPQQAPSHP